VRGSMIVLVVLLALLTLFTVQNPEIVTVRFLAFTGNTRLLVVIVAAFAAGVVGSGLAALPACFRRRAEAKASHRRTRELEAEVKALREEIYHLRRRMEAAPELPKPGYTI